jgi:XisI protein
MDQLTRYREQVKRCLSAWAAYVRRARQNGVEVQQVFDEVNDHYLVLYVGWDGDRRVWQTALHVRLQGGKIWVEVDETEEGIATCLVRAGVPREDIVLAFHPPALRHLTEFASA